MAHLWHLLGSKKIRQKDICNNTELSGTYISEIANDSKKSVPDKTLEAIAKACGMELEEFIGIGRKLHEGGGGLERAQQVNYFTGGGRAGAVNDSCDVENEELKYMEMLKWAYDVGNKRLQREILTEMLSMVGEVEECE